MGKSRCGKSMLANSICSKLVGYSKISLDYLVMAFKKVFGDLNLEYYKDKENKFTQFIETYFDNCIYKDNNCGIHYVLEGADFPKETILKLKNMKNTKVIFLGKTNISAEEFFYEIRKYENGLSTGGWTKTLDDKTLLSWCEDWIKKSKEYKEFCNENQIEFFDTSINQPQVLQDILSKIENNLI
jgi:hypothetical protein